MAGKRLPEADLERALDLIAEAIDRAGPERERMFLAKLALTLAAEAGDIARVEQAIRTAEQEVDTEPGNEP